MDDPNLKPVPFEEQNIVYVAPGCGDLPAFQDGRQIITCWEISDEQLQVLSDTKRIYLWVTGAAQPPVSVCVDYPFPDTSHWPEDVETPD